MLDAPQPQIAPALLNLTTIQDLFEWYRLNLCNARFMDPRNYRVRFNEEDFIHLIQLKTKHGKEHKNKRLAIEDIRRGRIHFVSGRFDPQRARELSWAPFLATQPDSICENWQALGTGREAYIKNFGGNGQPDKYRVLVCKVLGTVRQVATIFPRERIGQKELRGRLWP